MLGSSKKEDPQISELKHAVNALGVTIESINQRLAGTSYDTSLQKMLDTQLPLISANVQKLMNKMDEVDKRTDTIVSQWNEFKQLMFNEIKSLKESNQQLGQIVTGQLDQFQAKLQNMINIHIEEAQVMRTQNKIFLSQLKNVETVLNSLSDNK